MNEYVVFYEKNKISPVRQNIHNFSLHVQRRENLYRQLGLIKGIFEGKKVLEVGPGSGYNSLATYTFNPSKYVLIEPNTTGFKELKQNFFSFGFYKNVEFINSFLEEFDSNEKFDIVICEGLIQGLSKRKEFLKILSNKVKKNGVLVITVADEISIFFEILRRYLANELIKKECDFSKQVEILVRAFSSHLDTLKSMTRRYDDWCADLMCDAIYNHTFSVADAIDFFKDDYFFYGASPNIFQDFRWYKALPYEPRDYNEYYIHQFNEKRHNFINYKKTYMPRDANINIKLSNMCKKLIEIVKSLEKRDGRYRKKDLLKILNDIENDLKSFDEDLSEAIIEVIELSIKDNISIDEVANMNYLKPLFGRGQVFLSFNKFNDEEN